MKIVWDFDKGYWKWSLGIWVVVAAASVLIPGVVIMSVTARPTFWSKRNLLSVSLVRLSLTSLIAVSPIVLESACDVAASGSATGLSRLTWG